MATTCKRACVDRDAVLEKRRNATVKPWLKIEITMQLIAISMSLTKEVLRKLCASEFLKLKWMMIEGVEASLWGEGNPRHVGAQKYDGEFVIR